MAIRKEYLDAIDLACKRAKNGTRGRDVLSPKKPFFWVLVDMKGWVYVQCSPEAIGGDRKSQELRAEAEKRCKPGSKIGFYKQNGNWYLVFAPK